MSNTNDLDSDLEDLLSEFSNSEGTQTFDSSLLPQPKIENLSQEEDLEKFTSDKMQEFLSDLMSVNKTLLLNAKTTSDPELLNSMTALLNNTTKILDSFNKQVITDKNNKTKIELQKLKDNNKEKKLIDDVKGLISSREEAFKNILQQERDIKEAESIPAEEIDKNEEIND